MFWIRPSSEDVQAMQLSVFSPISNKRKTMPSKVGVLVARKHGRPIYAASVSICILTGEIDGSVAKHLVC